SQEADYASFLVTLAGRRLGLAATAGLSIGGGKSNLYRRVTMVLSSPALRNRLSRPRSVCLALLAITFIGLLSTVRFGAAQAEEEPAKVDLYGDPLPEGAVMRMGTVRLRHSGAANRLAFTSDGKSIVSSGYDHPIR